MMSQDDILKELSKGNDDAWVPIEGVHALVSVGTGSGLVGGLIAQVGAGPQQLSGARLDATKGMVIKAFYNTRTAEVKLFLAASLVDPVYRKLSRRSGE